MKAEKGEGGRESKRRQTDDGEVERERECNERQTETGTAEEEAEKVGGADRVRGGRGGMQSARLSRGRHAFLHPSITTLLFTYDFVECHLFIDSTHPLLQLFGHLLLRHSLFSRTR